MILGRVIGNVVATRKYTGLEGAKLLVVQVLDKELQPRGRPQVAVDVAQAGEGDTVFIARKREASIAYPVRNLPIDLAIVGIVEAVDLIEKYDLELLPGYTEFA
jgi:microcompartment protein CcmK/EutM